MTVQIRRGLPGSGKSTQARFELSKSTAEHRAIFSADDNMVDALGTYKFDPSRLKEVHAKCLRSFVLAMSLPPEKSFFIVDNTNLTVAEIAPYAALAQAFGHEMEIVTGECPAELCAKRNVHGVGIETILRMEATMKKQELPPWWPHLTKYMPPESGGQS